MNSTAPLAITRINDTKAGKNPCSDCSFVIVVLASAGKVRNGRLNLNVGFGLWPAEMPYFGIFE